MSLVLNKLLDVQPLSVPESTKKKIRPNFAFFPISKLIPGGMNFPPSAAAMNLTRPKDLTRYSPVRVVTPGLISLKDLVFDVRLETYRRPRGPIKLGDLRFLANCPVSGWIRLHGVWIGYFDSSGNFVSIRRYEMKDLSKLIEVEIGKLTQQLSEEELEHLKMFWFDGENSGLKFMAHQGVKHSSYFCDENLEYKQVPAYYNKVNSLASQFFDGGDFDIQNVMKDNGLRLGEYYNGKKLLEVLKNAYGEYPFVRFKKEDGHPVLHGITMLYSSGEYRRLLEHPQYMDIPRGEFLFRSVDF